MNPKKVDKHKIKRFIRDAAESTKDYVKTLVERGQETWDIKSPTLKDACRDYQNATKEYAKETLDKAKNTLDRFSSGRMRKLEKLVCYQGGYYRELCRARKEADMGGNSDLAMRL